MKLFDRRATLIVGAVVIKAGASVDFSFEVEKTLDKTPNKCTVNLYNLEPTKRTALASLDKVPTALDAGYKEGLARLFFGNLRTVTSTRDGPDIVTTITGGDGEAEYQKSRVNQVIPKGTDIADALTLIALSAGLLPGNIKIAAANLVLAGGPKLQAPLVVQGSAVRAIDMLVRSSAATWSIQDKALQIIPRRAVLPGAVYLEPGTGLLGSPSIDNKGLLHAEALLIPDLAPGRLVVVRSEFVKGQFKVEKCLYKGDTSSDEWGVTFEASRF